VLKKIGSFLLHKFYIDYEINIFSQIFNFCFFPCLCFDELCIILLNITGMAISKTEVNLKRLLAAAPQQQNQAKLVHVSMKINPDYLFYGI
jgi:hypothetical protein